MYPIRHAMDTFRRRARELFWVLATGMIGVSFPARALLPFPLTAGQEGYVTCLANPNISYECYLPSNYSTNGAGGPIFYEFNPSGGTIDATVLTACQNLNYICVDLTNNINGQSWDQRMAAMYAVSRDVRTRILYDPSEEFAGGLSGGGECAYMFARMRAQHVAGVMECAGWLGRGNSGASVQYYGIDRVQTNLLIMRSTGNTDTSSEFYLPFDSNYLATCSVRIQDYPFSGGHEYPPESTLQYAMERLSILHRANGPNDEQNALMLYTNWQARIAAGGGNSVLYECVSNLMNFPRTWFAYQAELTLDQLLTNYAAFSQYNVCNLGQGDFADDLFYYYARGAADTGDTNRYYSCLKALTGVTANTNDYVGTTVISGINSAISPFVTTNAMDYITTTINDHAQDVSLLETNFGYGNPWTLIAPDPGGSSLTLTLLKSAPWLQYNVEENGDLLNGSWGDANDYNATETPSLWSATVDLPSGANAFYLISTVVGGPCPSPYWPVWPPN